MGGFPDGSLGKDPACNAEAAGGTGFDTWVGKIPWRRKWQPTPVFLPGKSHGQSTLVSYSLKGRKESDVTEHKIYGRKQWLAGSDNCLLNEQDWIEQ